MKVESEINKTINESRTDGTGTVLVGRYRIVRKLGEGGMGSVWLAEDLKLDNDLVAIKMLPSILVRNKKAYAQVKQEAKVSLKLSHANIVKVRTFEEDDDNPFLVLDYIEGESLEDYLAEKGALSESETVRLMTPVAAALDAAHEQGVVHRDVKPGNVMIAKNGKPYILDFGIAREVKETMTKVTGRDSSGTILYMSPEQQRGDDPSPAQDVYSFAAMVYECLTGNPPFYRGDIADQIKNKQPTPLSDKIGVGAAVLSGLGKTPDARPKTCAGVISAVAPEMKSSEQFVPREGFVRKLSEVLISQSADETVATEVPRADIGGTSCGIEMTTTASRKGALLIWSYLVVWAVALIALLLIKMPCSVFLWEENLVLRSVVVLLILLLLVIASITRAVRERVGRKKLVRGYVLLLILIGCNVVSSVKQLYQFSLLQYIEAGYPSLCRNALSYYDDVSSLPETFIWSSLCDDDSGGPLIWAAEHGYRGRDAVAIAKMLVGKWPGLIKRRSRRNVTPLMILARGNDNMEFLKFLIDSGADVNAEDDEGNTALHYAVSTSGNTYDTVKMLLECGADAQKKNKKGKTAYEHGRAWTCMQGYSDGRKLLKVNGG